MYIRIKASIIFVAMQCSEPVKELYTQLTEKLEAQKKSPPEPEEAPSLDLGLHSITVPTTPATPTTRGFRHCMGSV